MEATFLASREPRLASLQSRQKRNEGFDIFSSEAKAYLAEWSQRLQSISTRTLTSETSQIPNEADKRQLSIELNQLKDDLLKLKRHCFSHVSSIGGVDSISTKSSVESSGMQSNLPALPDDDLPPSYWQWLHDELTKHQELLDQVRAKQLPKGKFVFRKYREAVRRRQEALLLGHSAESCALTTTAKPDVTSPTPTATVSEEQSAFSSCCIESLVSTKILVDEHGRAYKQSQGTSEGHSDSYDASEAIMRLDLTDGESPMVLRNIRDVIINLNGTYQSLHLMDVSQTTIRLPKSVLGAVHATNCRRVVLQIGSCQQIRLHESADLRIQVDKVFGGAILEDCHRVVFVTTGEPSSTTLDVKDFSFLKRGIASPNFTIESKAEDCVGETTLQNIGPPYELCSQTLPNTTEAEHKPVANTNSLAAESAAPEEDDDDEL